MAYVITEKCHGERYGLCAGVCPVEAIFPGTYQGKDFMVIDPALCISCGACAAECRFDLSFTNFGEHSTGHLLLCPALRFMRLSYINFLSPLGSISQDDNPVGTYFEEAAINGDTGFVVIFSHP